MLNGFTDLPAPDELREMLAVIPPSDRDAWVAVTKILGRCYPGNEEVYQVVREWGSRYEGRKPEDETHERRDFFAPASASDVSVGFGAFQKIARDHGWQPKRVQRAREGNSQPEAVAPAAVTAPKPEAEGGSPWEARTYDIVTALAARVVRYVLYAPRDADRSDFLARHSSELRFFPDAHRRVIDLLAMFMRSHSEYTLPAFVSWAGEKNRGLTMEQVDAVTTGDMPETRERCEDVWQDLAMRSSALIAVQEAEEFRRRVMARPWTAGDEAAALFHSLAPVTPREIFGASETAAMAEQEVRELRDPSLREQLFVPTGMPVLDEATGGFRRGEVSILAAYSGAGKTWFGIDMARRALASGRRVLFVSAEMAPQSIAGRMLMNAEGISAMELGDTTRPVDLILGSFRRRMQGSSWHLYSGRGMTVTEIEGEIARHSFTGGLDLVIVDYLQLVRTSEKGEIWERVSSVMRRLTEVSSRYGCATLCLAQLSNPNKNGGQKRTKSGQIRAPGLYDIADSTAVVRDAALVVTIYSEDTSPRSATMKLKVLKSRYGRMTEFWLMRGNGGTFTETTANPDTRRDREENAS